MESFQRITKKVEATKKKLKMESIRRVAKLYVDVDKNVGKMADMIVNQ